MDKRKLLIVDDKEQIAKILIVYLREEFDCFYFPNPIPALQWLGEGNQPDLIISDIRMPEMTGDQFLVHLKSNELFRQIPVVMLSSEDSISERIRMLEEGAADYIVKPFNPMELKVRIKKIIG
ncbi:MAG: response regulator [Alistipes sp.]